MAVTRKEAGKQVVQAAGKNSAPAKKGSKNLKKQATPGNALVKKDSKKSSRTKKGPGGFSAARSYLIGVINELKKVHWPNRRETTIYTSVVLVAVLIVSALIWTFDWLLSGLLQLIY